MCVVFDMCFMSHADLVIMLAYLLSPHFREDSCGLLTICYSSSSTMDLTSKCALPLVQLKAWYGHFGHGERTIQGG